MASNDSSPRHKLRREEGPCNWHMTRCAPNEQLAVNALESETEAKVQARQAIENYVNLILDDAVLRDRRFQPLRRRLLRDAEKYYQRVVHQAFRQGKADYDFRVAAMLLILSCTRREQDQLYARGMHLTAAVSVTPLAFGLVTLLRLSI